MALWETQEKCKTKSAKRKTKQKAKNVHFRTSFYVLPFAFYVLPVPHDEEEHAEVLQAEEKVARRRAKKRRRMRVSGKSVFVLQTLVKRGSKSRTPARRKQRRRKAPQALTP